MYVTSENADNLRRYKRKGVLPVHPANDLSEIVAANDLAPYTTVRIRQIAGFIFLKKVLTNTILRETMYYAIRCITRKEVLYGRSVKARAVGCVRAGGDQE